MKPIFVLLSIWHFFSLALIVQSAGDPRPRYYQVVEDRSEVNENILAYIEHKQKKKTFMSKVKKRRPVIGKKRNVLKLNRDETMELCTQAVPLSLYGLKLDKDSDWKPQVTKNKKFSLEHTKHGDHSFALDMVACPLMKYTDLETLEEKYFGYVYQLAKTKDRHSALIFRQILNSSKTYPARVITDINFNTLKERARSTYHPLYDVIEPNYSGEIIDHKINAYQNYRHSKKIYLRFFVLYYSFAICRLSRPYVVYMCRQIIEDEKNGHVEFDIKHYSEKSCKKRPIDYEYKWEGKVVAYTDLYFFLCPQPIRPSDSDNLSNQIRFLYFSSNLADRSVTVFSRFNRRGEKLRPIKVVRDVEVQKMKQEKRRQKIEPYPSEEDQRRAQFELSHNLSTQEIKERINSSNKYSTIMMPATLARQEEVMVTLAKQQMTIPLRFIEDRLPVEDFLIEYSQIKTNKLVYQRFQQTHFSIDFCQLSKIEKNYLCDEALKYIGDELNPNTAESSFNRQCFRQAIMLKFREVDGLTTDMFSIWECPESKNHPDNVYFMGKSHLRDTVFLFKAPNYERELFESVTVIYTDMLVYKVNRYKLAKLYASSRRTEEPRQYSQLTSETTSSEITYFIEPHDG